MVSNKNKGSPNKGGRGRGGRKVSADTLSSPGEESSSSINARQYTRVQPTSKGQEDYIQRRSRNNEAVKKSREKARFKQEQVIFQTDSCEKLTEIHLVEHKRLTKMIELLRKTITDEGTPEDEEQVKRIIDIDTSAQNDFKRRVAATKEKADRQLAELQEQQEKSL